MLYDLYRNESGKNGTITHLAKESTSAFVRGLRGVHLFVTIISNYVKSGILNHLTHRKL